MTREEKDLLLKDLCARLPYGVKLKFNYIITSPAILKGINKDFIECDIAACELEDVKPYLFPISSITKEQKEEHKDLLDNQYSLAANGNIFTLQDFYCKYHLDYRGLIEKGLAIDATNLNIY